MWCAFVHVDHSIEQFQMGIPLLKAAGIFFKHRSRFFTHIGIHSGVITVADLEYRFMEFFFLSAVTDMFLIICDLPITSFLFIVVLCKCFIEQLMIELFQRTLTDDYIITDPVLIDIFGYDRTVVVVEVSTTETAAQSSLYYTITLLMNMPLKRLRKWMSLHSRRSVRSTE